MVRVAAPFGSNRLEEEDAVRMGLEFTLRPRGRPREPTERNRMSPFPPFPACCTIGLFQGRFFSPFGPPLLKTVESSPKLLNE